MKRAPAAAAALHPRALLPRQGGGVGETAAGAARAVFVSRLRYAGLAVRCFLCARDAKRFVVPPFRCVKVRAADRGVQCRACLCSGGALF